MADRLLFVSWGATVRGREDARAGGVQHGDRVLRPLAERGKDRVLRRRAAGSDRGRDPRIRAAARLGRAAGGAASRTTSSCAITVDAQLIVDELALVDGYTGPGRRGPDARLSGRDRAGSAGRLNPVFPGCRGGCGGVRDARPAGTGSAVGADDERLRALIASPADAVVLAALIDRCWPRATERTVPAARVWLAAWGPARMTASMSTCTCRAGRCAACN